MKTVSKIVESDQKIIQKAQRTGRSSAIILHYLDVMAEKLGKIAAFTNKTIAIEILTPNVALTVKYSQPIDLKVVGIQTKNGNLSLGFMDTGNGTVYASAKIPAETFKNKSKIVYSFLFQNDALFQTEDQIKNQLSSKVLAVSFGKEKIRNLTLPIQLIFKKIKKIKTVDNVCVFWAPAICK